METYNNSILIQAMYWVIIITLLKKIFQGNEGSLVNPFIEVKMDKEILGFLEVNKTI